ncbi:MAG: phage holin family protein [Nocardioidaceae bacterium]
MKRIITTVLVDAGALAVAAWLFTGIRVNGATETDRVVTLLVVAAIFGVINAFIAPVVKTLALPFIILTLGLLLIVINALLLELTAWVAKQGSIGFHVNGFWTAVGGAIVVSIVSWALTLAFDHS